MKTLINLLNSNKNISAWKINSTESKTCELFYVMNKLETNRSTDVSYCSVTLYVDKEDKRGVSRISIPSSLTEEEIKLKIEEGVFAATLALNPFFEIPEKEEGEIASSKTDLDDNKFQEQMEGIVKAIFDQDVYKEGKLSATEIFLTRKDNRVINSKGVDYSFSTYEGFVEAIPTWVKENKEEFETYNSFKFGTNDVNEIANKIKEALKTTSDRAKAIALPRGTKCNVIFKDEELLSIIKMFVEDLSYGAEVRHMSLSKVGESVQGKEIVGDKLNITMLPCIDGVVGGRPVDGDGVLLKPLQIVKDGIAINRFGSYQMGYYLGEKNPTGDLSCVELTPGSVSIEEIKKTPYVECSRMSSMQADIFSGFFGGECRLGYYFDGEKEVPATSFSVSANFHKVKGELIFSKETTILPGYKGPKYVIIRNCEIS